MASLLRFAYVMAIGRAVSGWRLEAVLFGGVLLAVALMASGVIFSDLLSNAALRDALLRSEPEDVNFSVRSYSSREDPPDIEGRSKVLRDRNDFVERNVAEPFRPYLKEHARYLETATFFFQGRPNLETDKDSRPRGPVVYLTGLDNRIRVVEGTWPQSRPGNAHSVDVAVDRLGAQLLGLGVGEVMEIFPATLFDDWPPIEVRITAIFEVLDPEEEFWYGLSSALSKKDDRWTLVPLFTSEEILLRQVMGAYPSLYADTTWYFYPDPESIPASETVEVQNLLAQIERGVSSGLKNSSYAIRLDNLLSEFEEQLLLARLPLLVMLFLVVAILVYYLALVSGLIVRSRSVEIATLKSRGATTWQIGILGIGEGLVVATPAVIIGPYVALGVIKLLGVIFFQLGGISEDAAAAQTGVSLLAFLLGLAGGLLAVLVFTAATLSASRHSSVEARQTSARPPTTNLLHRYYLDVALLAVIGFVWWQLQSRGAFLVQSLGSSELSIDYTLLLGPVLALLAAGLIILRAFPWATALLSRITGPLVPSWLLHVLRHFSRDPMTPAMLIVLVMLATALGVMGSAFSATLERGQRERALYEAGSDLRVFHGEWRGSNSLAESLSGTDGVEAAAAVLRSPAHLTTTGFSTSGVILAVDSDSIADAAWFRDDFANGRPIGDLASRLKYGASGELPLPEPDGEVLPSDATSLVFWARPGGSAQHIGLWARLRGSDGQVVDSWIGDLDQPQWSRLELPLTPEGIDEERLRRQVDHLDLAPPFSLVSIAVRSRLRENEGGAVFLGKISALTPGGERVIHDFSRDDGWLAIEDFRSPGLATLEISTSAAEDGFGATSRFSWATGAVGLNGVRTGEPDVPLPALVSAAFLEVADARVGDTVILGMSTHSLLLEVVDEVSFFPTLDPNDRPFAVVDLERFTQAVIRHSPRPQRGPNELWISSTPDTPVDSEAISAALSDQGASVRGILDAQTMVSARVEQPLVNAGWGALLVLLFLAVALASASGLMLFSHLDAKERQTEFALLRTLGISRGQMRRIVWTGLFLMVICGIGLGTLLGWLLGSSLLPLMEVAEEGSRVTPSLVFTTDWQRLLVSYVILAVITVSCGLWLTWLTGKLQLHQVLRMGE